MSLDLQRIRALCFDVDGTLSDLDDQYTRQYTTWLRRVPFVRRPDVLARRLVMWLESPGTAMLSMSDAVGVDRLVVPLIDWLHRHLPGRQSGYLIIPGVAQMLPRLKQHYPMAIISARDERHTLGFLESSGLAGYFDVILTGLSTPHTKPYPDPILRAAEMMGVRPDECLMIGDTTVDVRAAKAAGAQVVSVLCGFGEREELVRHGTDLILPTTAGLEQVLLGGRS